MKSRTIWQHIIKLHNKNLSEVQEKNKLFFQESSAWNPIYSVNKQTKDNTHVL